jgi:hypothetical protein
MRTPLEQSCFLPSFVPRLLWIQIRKKPINLTLQKGKKGKLRGGKISQLIVSPNPTRDTYGWCDLNSFGCAGEEIIGNCVKFEDKRDQVVVILRACQNMRIAYERNSKEGIILRRLGRRLVGRKLGILRTDISAKPVVIRVTQRGIPQNDRRKNTSVQSRKMKRNHRCCLRRVLL